MDEWRCSGIWATARFMDGLLQHVCSVAVCSRSAIKDDSAQQVHKQGDQNYFAKWNLS